MPNRDLFVATKTSTATENYYSTLLHESAHATGHSSRLDRLDLKNRKGYAFEELVAELSAAFLCNQLAVSSSPRDDHAQYLASWLKALDGDGDYIFKAASEAQKVVDWMDAKQVALPLQNAA
jgi:antirestriction protein ArdC